MITKLREFVSRVIYFFMSLGFSVGQLVDPAVRRASACELDMPAMSDEARAKLDGPILETVRDSAWAKWRRHVDLRHNRCGPGVDCQECQLLEQRWRRIEQFTTLKQLMDAGLNTFLG